MAGVIPFFNIKSLHKDYEQELYNAAKTVISSTDYILNNDKFEEEFAQYTGSKYCVGVNSGTAALHVALMALDIKEGDEVITVGYTFKATVASILYVGATPVYIDIDPNTYCMDVEKLEEKITKNTKCIIPVHLFGNAVDMPRLMQIAKKYNIPVVEDCAQAHGTTINGQHVGTFGDIGAFSFYPSKNIGALGDSGCIITNNESIAKDTKMIRTWKTNTVGYNYRMDNIQSAFLSVKLKYYTEILDEKRKIANIYNKHFSNAKSLPGVDHSYNIYTILVNERDDAIYKISNKVQTRVYYPNAVYKEHPFISTTKLDNTDKLALKQLSLPIYPTVDVNKVIETIEEKISDKLCSFL